MHISNKFGEDKYLAGELIARESSFNPTITNVSSGACGLGQAYPCQKLPCVLENSEESIACQLDWIDQYVEKRYGGFSQAIAFHNKNNWY